MKVHLTRVGEGRKRIALCGAKAMPYPGDSERAAGWECGTSRRALANCKACLEAPLFLSQNTAHPTAASDPRGTNVGEAEGGQHE